MHIAFRAYIHTPIHYTMMDDALHKNALYAGALPTSGRLPQLVGCKGAHWRGSETPSSVRGELRRWLEHW